VTGDDRQRIDKWLWFARLAKTRTLAQKLAVSGRVRINRERNDSASQPVKIGDTLTIAFDAHVRVLRIVAIGARRGPSPEARGLYEDLSPPPAPAPVTAEVRDRGAGRPTKRDRRAIDAFRGSSGDDFPRSED
jgi:ribosome-associated heat shock protein Hsp15